MQSHAIDIDGRFVGAAVREDSGYRFVALDIRLDELDGTVWATLAEMRYGLRAVAVADARATTVVAPRHWTGAAQPRSR